MSEEPKVPEIGFVRLKTVLELIPVSSATWWRWVKSGDAPKPVQLSPGVTAWNIEELREWIRTRSK